MTRPTKRDIEQAVRELDTITGDMDIKTEFVTIESPEDIQTSEFYYDHTSEKGKGE